MTGPLHRLPKMLTRRREAIKVRMQDVADNLGISHRALTRWLNDRDHHVKLADFERIADALDCDLEVTLRPRFGRDTSPATKGGSR